MMLPARPPEPSTDDLAAELRRCRTLAAQTERLCGMGTWQLGLDDGRLDWSEGTYRLFGLDPARPVTLTEAIAFYPEASRLLLEAAMGPAIDSGEPYDVAVQCRMADGSEPWIRSIGQVDIGPDGRRSMIGVVRDVTAEMVAADRLRQQADQDSLTGLCNRRRFMAALEAGLSGGHSLALLLMDLDRFKDVNDRHGHGVGDELLVEVGRRLRRAVRGADVVARLGGDEFALLLPDVTGAALVDRLASLMAVFEAPAQLAPGPIPLGVSLGAAVTPEGGTSAGDLLKNADIALYQAKGQGRGQACVFSRELGRELDERLGLLADVRDALRQGALAVHYQPIIDLRTSAVRGMEALVRWNHPSRGLLSPGAFLPALADPVLSAEIGSFVLARSLCQMREWVDRGLALTCVNVNISESQLYRGPALVEEATGLLALHGLTPDRLKLEILEGAFLGRRGGEVADTIALFQRQGISMVLDDFGTGYASLTHLKQFQVSRIKIDRSFVDGVERDAGDAAITRAIIDLGRNLGIRVTAEGIETPGQLAVVQRAGCDCGQGYLFSRPLPADAVPDFLERWTAEGHRLLDAAG